MNYSSVTQKIIQENVVKSTNKKKIESKHKDQKHFRINGSFFKKPFVFHELVIFNHGNFRCQQVNHAFRVQHKPNMMINEPIFYKKDQAI